MTPDATPQSSVYVRLVTILDDLGRLSQDVHPLEIQRALQHVIDRLDAMVEETIGMHHDATPERSKTVAQDARLAYQAYRDALHLAFPMDWEKVPAATQHAWRAVVRALRTTRGGPPQS